MLTAISLLFCLISAAQVKSVRVIAPELPVLENSMLSVSILISNTMPIWIEITARMRYFSSAGIMVALCLMEHIKVIRLFSQWIRMSVMRLRLPNLIIMCM